MQNKITKLTLSLLSFLAVSTTVHAEENVVDSVTNGVAKVSENIFSGLSNIDKLSIPNTTINPWDYNSPLSTANDLRVNFKYDFASKGEEITSNTGNANLVYKTFYSTLPFAWSLDLLGAGSTNKDNKGVNSLNYSFDLGTQFNKYIWDDKGYFGFGKLNSNFNNEFELPASRIVAGAGYGRFLDARPLAKSVKISDFLLQQGILKKQLDKQSLLDIAELVQGGDGVESKLTKISEILSNQIENFSITSFNPTNLLKLRDLVVSEEAQNRFIGWDVTAGLGYEITTSKGFSNNSPVLDLGARYSMPIDWKFQINEKLSASTPITGDIFMKTNLTLTSDLIYNMLERLDLTAAHILTLETTPGSEAQLGNTLTAGFIFYIANQVNLVFTGQVDKIGDNPLNTGLGFNLRYDVF